VGALERFVKIRESRGFLCVGDTGDVGGGIWRAEREIARSDTRDEWWVRSI
jgi:hypothetical protein